MLRKQQKGIQIDHSNLPAVEKIAIRPLKTLKIKMVNTQRWQSKLCSSSDLSDA